VGEATSRAGLYPRGFSQSVTWRWDLIPARELINLNYGRALKADIRASGTVPVYGTNGQCGWHDQSLANGPGLIIGRKGQGPLGVEWCESGFWVIDTAYFVTTLRPDLNLQYLYHLIKYIGLNHLKDGTSNPTLSRDTFGAQLFPVPPPFEQEAIARILGALDDKIALNRRMNATLETMARALFQSWFVDFDPVRAKLDGQVPVGLDPAIAALFPNQFQHSAFGLIPQAWTAEPVGEVVTCVGGGTPSTTETEYWLGGKHHWTTPKDFSSLQSPILLDTDRKISDSGLARISSGLLPAGTLLLSSRAPVGYLAIAAIPVAINQGFIAMKCNVRASNFFMLNWCQANMTEIESRATGTTFAEISKQNFRPIPVVLPPPELMAVFTDRVTPLYAQITTNLRQSRTLAALRDTLLPRLLSGELRVDTATHAIEDLP
jgi:type I restriction enzyme S subunit